MRRLTPLLALFLFLTPVFAKIKVVCTIPTLSSIVKEIGGNKVEVITLAPGERDPHYVEPRPSMVVNLRDADMLVKVGMDLDMWVDSLVDASGNKKIMWGSPGYVDCSVGIKKLEVPKGRVSMKEGEIHIYGNPHYWLSPENGEIIAKNILEGLLRVAPAGDKEYFQKRAESFLSRLRAKEKEWREELKPFRGTKFVSYHRSFSYFAKCFDLDYFGTLEPKPGIPPSTAHIAKLIKDMKAEGVKLILLETYYPRKFADMVAKETGAKVVIVPSAVGATKEAENYFSLFDTIISRIRGALKG
ncbi:MAG: metal ABC transporter substrate-binding protein [bacterium]